MGHSAVVERHDHRWSGPMIGPLACSVDPSRLVDLLADVVPVSPRERRSAYQYPIRCLHGSGDHRGAHRI